MNIKTLLTDEEMKLAVGNAISDWAMSDYKDGWGDDAMAQDNYCVIRNAQDAKTKRVIVEWLKSNSFDPGISEVFFYENHIALPETKYQEFKKWALGE